MSLEGFPLDHIMRVYEVTEEEAISLYQSNSDLQMEMLLNLIAVVGLTYGIYSVFGEFKK